MDKGIARPKNESTEEKKLRKKQIKEEKKANRQKKKSLKGAYKMEEASQKAMLIQNPLMFKSTIKL